MPWLRHRRWKYATALSPVVTVCASRRVYRCTGADGGVVEVPYRTDVDELLSPPGDQEAVWEVAWDRYGVAFDAQGKEGSPAPPIPCEPTSGGPIGAAVGGPTGMTIGRLVKPRGRPRKR